MEHKEPEIKTGLIMDAVSKAEEAEKKNSEVQEVNPNVSSIKMFKKTKTLIRKHSKTGRNDLCPCGSGKKYKNCCLSKGIFEGLEEKQ